MTTFSRVWYLLSAEERRSAVKLFGLMLVGMGLEMIGVGLVIPAFAMLSQGEPQTAYPAVGPWLQMLGNPSRNSLILMGMFVLVVVYAFKTLFLIFLAWAQARFVFGLQARISQRLFEGYLRQHYEFHLQRNSAELVRNIVGHASGLTSVLQQGLLLLTECLVSLGIAVLLLAVEPLGAVVVVSLLGGAGWVLHHLSRKKLHEWGEQIQRHEALRLQHLQQGLGGAKEVKLLGRESEFLERYWSNNSGIAHICRRQATVQAAPRLLLELFAILGIGALVGVMVLREKPFEAFLPTLGLFGAAAFRLMPSVTRVVIAGQYARFYLPVVDTVCDEVRVMDAHEGPVKRQALPLHRALTLEAVGFCYPSTTIPALKGINLTIPRGASIGIIGGSGGGKSTLVDVILGLLTPSEGVIRADGIDIQGNLRGWQDQVGYVPQSIFLTDDTLRCNIAFGVSSREIDDAAVWRAVRAAQLDDFIAGLPQGIESVVGERGVRLSGGQRQRVGIARALYHAPSVLVLDEATSALDTMTEAGVMEAVRSLKGDKTVIIVAHRLSTVTHCDYLYRLEGGAVVEEGSASEVLSNHPPA